MCERKESAQGLPIHITIIGKDRRLDTVEDESVGNVFLSSRSSSSTDFCVNYFNNFE